MSATSNTKVQNTCPLCGYEGHCIPLKSAINLSYWLCRECKLIFIDRADLPDPADEKKRYLTHQNGIEYPGYVQFLYRAIDQALPYLEAGMKGLDYGCGPSPTLSILLQREGFACQDYDPVFFPELPRGPFDYIFATESAEHFFDPRMEFSRIADLLHSRGILIIMTEFWKNLQDFSTWYYVKDFTHVSLYHLQTIQKICELFGYQQKHFDNERIFILRKNN